MPQIEDNPSVPESVEAIIFPSVALARVLAPYIRDDIAVMSPDDAFASKLHLHAQDGEITTQVNVGASVDWETTMDLRL